jgi:hypothetical protein
MKLVTTVFLVAVSALSSTVNVQAFTFRTIESFSYDWNGDGKPYTFLLDKIENWNDPGDYHRLTIKIPGKKVFVLDDRYGLVKYSSYCRWSHQKIPAENLLATKSEYLVLATLGNTKKPVKLLFLFGYEYSSQPSMVHIIALDETGNPEIVFEGQLGIFGLTGMMKDGYAELIGYHGYSGYTEHFGSNLMFESYNPRYVYAVSLNDSKVKISFDTKLTEEYNTENYVWKGLKHSKDLEGMVVVIPKNGKPELMNVNDAEKKYGVHRYKFVKPALHKD